LSQRHKWLAAESKQIVLTHQAQYAFVVHHNTVAAFQLYRNAPVAVAAVRDCGMLHQIAYSGVCRA